MEIGRIIANSRREDAKILCSPYPRTVSLKDNAWNYSSLVDFG